MKIRRTYHKPGIGMGISPAFKGRPLGASLPDMSDYLWAYLFASTETLPDDLGGNYDLTNNNNVTYDATEGAANFTAASNQYFSRTHTAALQHGTQDHTMVARFKSKDVAPTNQWIYSKRSAGSDEECEIWFGGLGPLFTIFDSQSNTQTIDSDAWNILVVKRYASGLHSMQVNGGTVLSTTESDDLLSNGPVLIGARGATGSFHFNGYIDYIMRWNRIISDEETTQVFAGNTELMVQ